MEKQDIIFEKRDGHSGVRIFSKDGKMYMSVTDNGIDWSNSELTAKLAIMLKWAMDNALTVMLGRVLSEKPEDN